MKYINTVGEYRDEFNISKPEVFLSLAEFFKIIVHYLVLLEDVKVMIKCEVYHKVFISISP